MFRASGTQWPASLTVAARDSTTRRFGRCVGIPCCPSTHIYTHTYTHTHSYTLTHTHTHTDTHTLSFSISFWHEKNEENVDNSSRGRPRDAYQKGNKVSRGDLTLLSFGRLFVHPSVRSLVHSFVCLFVRLLAPPSIHLFVRPSVGPLIRSISIALHVGGCGSGCDVTVVWLNEWPRFDSRI